MKLCRCSRRNYGKAASVPTSDRLYCASCDGWKPPATTVHPDSLADVLDKAGRLLHAIGEDYRWTQNYTTPAGPQVLVAGGDEADPTRIAATDPRAVDVAAWRRLAAGLAIIALDAVELADAALGEARYVVDPRPGDHVKAAYHDTIPEGRDDLREAHEAKARRQGRGEGYGAA